MTANCSVLDQVNICGIPHKITACEDHFDVDCHFAMIDYKKAEIRVNKDLDEMIGREAIIHEMVHGMLVHLGYDELSNDERFVQGMANAIMQGFYIRAI